METTWMDIDHRNLKGGTYTTRSGIATPKRRAQPRIKMELEEMEAAGTTSEISNLVVTSWEGAVAQGKKFPHRTEKFAD
jgi:hypothetical protein